MKALSILMTVAGVLLILLGLWVAIPVILQLPDSWVGTLLMLLWFTGGLSLISRALQLRQRFKLKTSEGTLPGGREHALPGTRHAKLGTWSMNVLIVAALLAGTAFSWLSHF